MGELQNTHKPQKFFDGAEKTNGKSDGHDFLKRATDLNHALEERKANYTEMSHYVEI